MAKRNKKAKTTKQKVEGKGSQKSPLRKKRKPIKKSRILKLFSPKNLKRLLFLLIVLGIAAWGFSEIQLPTDLDSKQIPVSTKIFDRNGKLIYEIYADKRSTPVDLSELPDYVIKTTIAIEDKDFYKHYGVSFTGIARAVYKITFKKQLEGGSTLTQQLVKNTLLTPERTLKRKIKELALTIIVETMYSKDKILDMYLNQIPYGSTAYGIGAASELYFDKPAKELTLAEAALLAGLPAAPSRYSPFGAYPELAKERQDTVLRRMVEDGYITNDEAETAKQEELKFSKVQDLKAPHFALWVKNQLAEKYGESVVEKAGLRVTTTLDLDLQEFAQLAVAEEVSKLKNQRVGNGAALVTRPSTGEILAMVGSKDYFAGDEDGNVNIVFAKRQPGSSIKPLNYALGIKDQKITAATPIADVPTCFLVAGQTPYCPKNYTGGFHGAQPVRYALASSYNIPAVRVLALNGVENFINFSRTMGITTFSDPSRYGLSLTLGGGEVMPADMAVAFGVFANGGIKQPLIYALKIEDWKGNVLEETKLNNIELSGERVLGSDVAFIISDILKDNAARTPAFGPASDLVVRDHPEVSVKTGTTNDLKDNWTIGYTGQAVVVVWVGNNNNTSMSGTVSGVSGASPIWNTVIKHTLDKAEKGTYNTKDQGHSWPRKPDSVVGANICGQTGTASVDGCAGRYEYFLAGTIPNTFRGGTQEVEYHIETGEFITPETPEEFREKRTQLVYYDPLGTFLCLDCGVSFSSQSATIRYPLEKREELSLPD
jgi:penicillin-binding protein 1C